MKMNKKGFALALPVGAVIALVVGIVLIVIGLPILVALMGVKIAGIALIILGGIIMLKFKKLVPALIMIGIGIAIIVGVNFDILGIAGGIVK